MRVPDPLKPLGLLGTAATKKVYRLGTHRVAPPAETLAVVRPLLPAMGITRIANVTGLDQIGLPVVMVCRPNSRALSVSQGKGVDLDSAKASGLMESIESFHAERIHLPLKLASFNEMCYSHDLIDLEGLPRPVHSQFNEEWRMLWVEGADLVSGGSRWTPFETVFLDFRSPPPTGSGAFHQSSNGLASGNHLLEAISHGVCELIERDASSLWHASTEDRQKARRLDLETVDDSQCLEVLARYEKAGVAVGVWETTSDIGLASFDCMILERDLDVFRPLPAAFGAGCHPSRAIALLRALTEAAQSRLTSISGSRDDMDRSSHERAQQRETLKALLDLIEEPGLRRDFRQAPDFSTSSLDEDVALELERLQAAGLKEVVVVDLTRPDFEIPVVKVVIPGLEAPHRLAGYTPGPRAAAVFERKDGA